MYQYPYTSSPIHSRGPPASRAAQRRTASAVWSKVGEQAKCCIAVPWPRCHTPFIIAGEQDKTPSSGSK